MFKLNNGKIIIFLSMVSFCAILFLTDTALATTPTTLTSGLTSLTSFGLSGTSVFELLSTILNWLLSLVGILGVIGFVVSGVMYLTSVGDTKAIEKAKSIMLYSIIGVIAALVGLIVVYALSYIFIGGSYGY
jgi:hypothetical protein